MVTQQLIEYIRAQRATGATKEAITATLTSSGWMPQDIAAGIAATEPATPTKTPIGFAPATNVVQPTQPVQPIQPLKPVQPIQPVAQPMQPIQPTPAAQPLQPIQPVQPIVTAQPMMMQPAQPSQPMQPVQPIQAAQPMQVAQPMQPTQPAQPARSQPTPITQPQPTEQKKARSMTLWVSVVLLLLLLVAGAWGAAYWYRAQAQQPASSQATTQKALAKSPVSTNATSTQQATSVFTYPYTPSASNIPGFSLQYLSIFGMPQTTESPTDLTVTFSNAISALSLDFSLSANPLSALQSPQAYVQAMYPTASSTDLTTNDHTIVKVVASTTPQIQSVFYIFLKNQQVLSVKTVGTVDSADQNALIQSIQFTDSTY